MGASLANSDSCFTLPQGLCARRLISDSHQQVKFSRRNMIGKHISKWLLLPIAGLAFVTAPTAVAQETWGSVRGTVTDASGAGVPNAQVELAGGALPRALTATTNTIGVYQFMQVPAGPGYTVSVT